MSAIDYRTCEGFPSDEVIAWVVEVSGVAFARSADAVELREALGGRKSIYTCVAFEGERPVGFKLGYMERPHYFESWRGGPGCAPPGHRR